MAENEWTDEQLRDHLADIDASPVDAVMPAHCRMCAEALRLAAPHPHPQGEAMTDKPFNPNLVTYRTAEPEPWRPSKGDRVRFADEEWAVVHVERGWVWIKADRLAYVEHKVVPLTAIVPWEPPTETVPWWEALRDGRRIEVPEWPESCVVEFSRCRRTPSGLVLTASTGRYKADVEVDADGMVEVLREDTRP